MYKQLIILILAIALFFLDINVIGMPYIAFVACYIIYMIYNKNHNEIALAIPLFGYSFGLLVNKLVGLPNLFVIVLLSAIIFAYRMFFFFNGKTKINANHRILIFLYGIFLVSILFSIFQFYQDSYTTLKLQLFGMWFLIYMLSFNSFDDDLKSFNYERFLILIFLFFVCHFSNATDAGLTLSPYKVWTTYSVLDDGIRGHDFDIISATRIAGAGILAYLIYIYDLKKEKIYLYVLGAFFVMMVIICQTRQSVASIGLPLMLFILYVLMKSKTSLFKTISAILGFVALFFVYMNYLESNNVESRIVTSTGGNSEEGTGREGVWEDAVKYINSDQSSVGFGNYGRFTNSYSYPHNIFLEIYVELGFISFLFFCLIVLYVMYESMKLFFDKREATNLELFLILASIYYIGLAQFSADFSRNLMFFHTFSLYIAIRYNKNE